jgi:hypothetical protein
MADCRVRARLFSVTGGGNLAKAATAFLFFLTVLVRPHPTLHQSSFSFPFAALEAARYPSFLFSPRRSIDVWRPSTWPKLGLPDSGAW